MEVSAGVALGHRSWSSVRPFDVCAAPLGRVGHVDRALWAADDPANRCRRAPSSGDVARRRAERSLGDALRPAPRFRSALRVVAPSEGAKGGGGSSERGGRGRGGVEGGRRGGRRGEAGSVKARERAEAGGASRRAGTVRRTGATLQTLGRRRLREARASATAGSDAPRPMLLHTPCPKPLVWTRRSELASGILSGSWGSVARTPPPPLRPGCGVGARGAGGGARREPWGR